MDEKIENKSISSGWYLLGGLAVGAIAGLLLAPKKGSETWGDIEEWRRRSRAKARAVLAQISALPSRVKVAGAAARDGAAEAFNESRDNRDKAKHLARS